jgi:hypothetical protein
MSLQSDLSALLGPNKSIGQEFRRVSKRAISLGVELNSPVDLVPPGKYPLLQNVRSYQGGRIEARQGLVRVAQAPIADTNVHSIARMNDYVFQNYVRFLGAGTNLYSGVTSFAQIDTGYSGDPLSIVPYRPDQSPRVWAYIANANKMRKVDTDNTVYNVGVAPPIDIPSAELAPPNYLPANVFDLGAGNWGATGATIPVLGNRLTGVTIGTILYINGVSGWALIAPSGGFSDAISTGMRLIINGGAGNQESATVEDTKKVFVPNASPALTVTGIIYDNPIAATGLATITLSQQLNGIERNSLIQIESEWVRVISVTPAPTGVYNASFRVSTTVSHGVGSGITLPPQGNIYIYLANTHVAGEPLTATMQTSTIAGGSTGATGSFYTNAAAPFPYNFGSIGGVPIQPDDFIHVGVYIDHPEWLVEGKLVLDIDPNTTVTHTALDGNQNAYWKSFRPNDLQPIILSSETTDSARTAAIQLQVQNESDVAFATNLDGGIAPELQSGSSQQVLGQQVWTDFIWKVSDLFRVGSNQFVDLSTLRAIQFRITVAAGQTINVSVHNLWVGGGFGPDNFPNHSPFIYRVRYRSSATGAKSLPGPAMRTGIDSRRQAITVTCAQSLDPQVDKIDIERLGGTNPDWHYIATIANSSTPTYIDAQASGAIITNPPLDIDVSQPFAISDLPKTSTVTVSGTAVFRTAGSVFNTAWEKGTEVIVNGISTTLYASPSSTALLHVADTIPSGTGLILEINEPILAGQPLPVMWGPFYECLFGVGNPLDAGSVYFTNPTNPDGASVKNRIEVTSPSEKMQNGCLYDGRSYAFSDQRLFQVTPSSSATVKFDFTEIPNGKGLFAKWAFSVGKKIHFLSSDGIYETTGGEPICISDDIRPLFPQGDSPGFAVNSINPVDMTKIDNLRLAEHQGYVYFDYIDTSGFFKTLVYVEDDKAWYPDTYFSGDILKGVLSHYSETGEFKGVEYRTLLVGGNNNLLFTPGGTFDDNEEILCTAATPAENLDDPRAKKQFGDLAFDLDPDNTDITVTPRISNLSTALPSVVYNYPGRGISAPLDLSSGAGVFARNIGVIFNWSTRTGNPKIYGYDISYLLRPEDTAMRATDWSDDGYPGDKFFQGFLLTCDTKGLDKVIKIQGDQGDVETFTINHNGIETKPYVFTPPKIFSLVRIISTDTVLWDYYKTKWVWEPSPNLVTLYQTQGTTHDIPGYQFLKDGYIAHMSTADVILTINVDGTDFAYRIPSSGGVYVKNYLVFAINPSTGQALKGKLFAYGVSSIAPFRLFEKDCEVRVHSWIGGDYVVKQPFGDIHRLAGARI